MATLTEVFPCFFLSCKASAMVKPAKKGHGSHPPKFFVLFYVFLYCSMYFCVVLCIFVLFYVLFVLCRSLYCLCVYVCCTTATGWLPNCSLIYHIIYIIFHHKKSGSFGISQRKGCCLTGQFFSEYSRTVGTPGLQVNCSTLTDSYRQKKPDANEAAFFKRQLPRSQILRPSVFLRI